jgi:hypothetical protein
MIRAVKGLSMEKYLCWAAMGVSGLFLVLFVLDLFTGIPFGRPQGFIWQLVDILGAIACAIVLYLGWDAFKDVR